MLEDARFGLPAADLTGSQDIFEILRQSKLLKLILVRPGAVRKQPQAVTGVFERLQGNRHVFGNVILGVVLVLHIALHFGGQGASAQLRAIESAQAAPGIMGPKTHFLLVPQVAHIGQQLGGLGPVIVRPAGGAAAFFGRIAHPQAGSMVEKHMQGGRPVQAQRAIQVK